jgi:serine/threonine protein kinase
MTPQQQIAHYRITAKLGEGGMGEVYRATDTKLGREVAIKVLPESFARDAGRMARFEREAQVLASLNHPNIAQIYGVEDRALVMELVEGEPPKGPLPVGEALKIALQMAEALEYAHEKSIVHRDLKPANIKITPDGTVKLLDFGLAKAFATDGEAPAHRENSPTLTIGATEVGVILGTASYMSPEQAAAKPVDRRADIWSYGVVFWGLLTGERLFDGETISHTLADVLRAPIDFEKLPKETPRAIRTLLERCLDRNVKSRLRDIGEARVAIQNYLANPLAAVEKNEAAPSKFPWRFAFSAAVAIAMLAGSTATWFWFRQPVQNAPSLRLEINPPANAIFGNFFTGMAISPNGRMVVFSAQRDGVAEASLWLRRLDSLDARELPGTERGTYPFWSPDSNYVAFFAGDKLKRIDVSAGPPQVLCDARVAGGGSWSKEGVILFSSNSILQKVPASGGAAEPVTSLNASAGEIVHRNPEFLPDGRSFVFLVASQNGAAQGIYASRLDRPGERTKLVATNANAAYAPPALGHPGYLLWMRDSTLVAQPFDASRLAVVSDPVPVAESVGANRPSTFMNAGFGISSNGLLGYWSAITGANQLIWMTREGAREILMDFGRGGDPHFSPDGQRLVLERDPSSTGTGSFDIWIYELKRKVMTRLTFDPANDIRPVWSPDGRQIAFASNRNQGVYQVFRKNSDGAGAEEQMTRGPYSRDPTSWSPDGRYLLFREQHPKRGFDIWLLPLEGDHKAIPFAQTTFNENAAQFSPDGRWIAYSSDETGRPEIFIQPFPVTGDKWQVSDQGGELPKWRGDGKEIYFYSGGKIRAAGLQLQAGRVEIEPSQDLFALTRLSGPIYFYEVAPDGQRFLVDQPAEDSRGALKILTNWWSVLKQ